MTTIWHVSQVLQKSAAYNPTLQKYIMYMSVFYLFQAVKQGEIWVRALLCVFVLLTVLPSCQLFSPDLFSPLWDCVDFIVRCMCACVHLYLWPLEVETLFLIAYITNHCHIITILVLISVCACVKERERSWIHVSTKLCILLLTYKLSVRCVFIYVAHLYYVLCVYYE